MTLERDDLGPDPLTQFRAWFAEAEGAGIAMPEAAVLATADRSGAPSARVVLVKRVDTGFVFHTNHRSRKGRELAANPRAALVFHWQTLGRQVRAEGAVEHVRRAETEAYFAERPRGAQLGAWASPQSEPIADRAELETRLAAAAERLGDGALAAPPFWGGFRLVPTRIEFWEHGDDRLHDRFVYEREGTGWRITRLAP